MATNLQVTASTQQAVGAFNALAASIANANNQFNNLAQTMSTGQSVSVRYGSAIERSVIGAFDKLKAAVSGAIGVFQIFGAAIAITFRQLLKEMDRLQGFNAIMSVSTKSTDTAAASYDFLRKTADKLGAQFDGLATNYAKLVAAIPPGVKQLDIANRAFLGVSMAARTMHSSNADTQLMFYAITQMASKGVVSMEELRRQLGEKLPGVIQIAAKALQSTPEELEKAIRKGIVNSEKFLDVFGDALIRTFADSSEKASESVSASINRLTNVWIDFVKNILDSGAGDAIIGVFDALREKLSDPYLIERFGELVKYLADEFKRFIDNITAEDLRTGFDTATNGIQILVNVLGKVIEALTWITNNSTKALTVLGLLGGAAAGAATGAAVGSLIPGVGTVVGGVVGGFTGANAGGYAGNQAGKAIQPSAQQTQARKAQDAAGLAAKNAAAEEREFVRMKMMLPILSDQFKIPVMERIPKLRPTDPDGPYEKLFSEQNLTRQTVVKMAGILTDPRFKTKEDRLDGLKTLANTGLVLAPANTKLADVLSPASKKGGGKSAASAAAAAQRSEDSTYYKALGMDPSYPKDMANLNTLLEKSRLTQDQYNNAVQDLINKQPYMQENLRAERKEIEQNNQAFEQFMQTLVSQISVREELRQNLSEDLRLSSMKGDELRIEQQVLSELSRFRKVGLEMSTQEISDLREKFRLIESIRQVSAAEQQVLSATVDKYLPQITMLQGLEKALGDPSSGLTKQGATDFLVNQDPNAQGSQDFLDAQRRSMEEYYIWIDTLRSKDLLSEQTAQMMKAKASIASDQERIQNTSSFFGNLASLSESGNKRIASIGRAAAVAQATVDGYAAVQKALASAPPPWNYALAAAVGVAAAANVAKIAGVGFKDGGYTGSGGVNEVAGVVHGKEFVVNASATARNRSILESMNRGNTVGAAPSGGSAVSVVINNNAPDTKATATERTTPNGKEIEVTIERVVINSVRSGGRIASAMESQYGLDRSMGAAR